MEKGKRWLVSGPVVFVAALIAMLLLLVFSVFIPQELIQANMEESADYIGGVPQVGYALSGVYGTQLHYSADATWLSIAYGFDFRHPLESAMWSRYYLSGTNDVCKSFVLQVENQLPGNTQYLRYWHGAAAILRLLHIAINVRQIYIFHAVIMAGLFACLLWLLCRHSFVPEAVSLCIAFLMVSAWVVPLCLEYTWVFLVMLVSSVTGVCLALKKHDRPMGVLFLLTGMVTVYLDFLTAETLTLLVPLLLVLRMKNARNDSGSAMWRFSAKAVCLWLIGYCGMWAAKWAAASVVLRQNVMPLVLSHIDERLGGSVGVSLTEFLIGAVARNFQRLAFYDYGICGAAVLAVLIAAACVPVARGKVQLRAEIRKSNLALYLLLGCIPYIRFLVLRNHSWGHFCFTYRAQAASVLAVCFMILELVEKTPRKEKVNQNE